MLQVLKSLNRKTFALLLVSGLLGVIAVLPFMADMLENLVTSGAAAPDIPIPLVVVLALVQNGILLVVVIVIGMILSERVGLRMPLIHAWSTGQAAPKPKTIVHPGVLVGAATGAVLVGLEAAFFLRRLPAAMLDLFEIPLWKRLLAGVVYGGITEELLMRLFLLSLVAWLLGRWWKTAENVPTTGAFATAIVIVALVFGLGHLPATAALVPLTLDLVVRALVLNGAAGVAFGYLYWRHGLEAAMLGHMSTHVVMQVPGVMLLKSML